jgi:hypothetical protein
VEVAWPETLCPQCCSSPFGKTTWANALGENGPGKPDGEILFPKFSTLSAQISARYITCAQNNANQGPKPNPRVQMTGTMPFEVLGVDFTEVKPCWEYQYLLVLVCTYSGWGKSYPPHTHRKGTSVVKPLLKDIVPK